jgi:undecaprenyl diphosphate synthase
MDGNGRWAKEKLRRRIFGHEEGANSAREIIRSCRKLGIPHLTLYAFSKENWQRPAMEIEAIWRIMKRFLKSGLDEFVEKESRLVHIGDPEGIPEGVLKELWKVTDRTRQYDRLIVNLALNYGGRQEIVRAAARFAEDVRSGKCEPEDLSPEIFTRYFFTAGTPDPDLLIRTGGEQRVSNFLLWQIAYAEIYVTDIRWPDFREPQFIEALIDYQSRERRFGKTGEQIREPSAANDA